MSLLEVFITMKCENFFQTASLGLQFFLNLFVWTKQCLMLSTVEPLY